MASLRNRPIIHVAPFCHYRSVTPGPRRLTSCHRFGALIAWLIGLLNGAGIAVDSFNFAVVFWATILLFAESVLTAVTVHIDFYAPAGKRSPLIPISVRKGVPAIRKVLIHIAVSRFTSPSFCTSHHSLCQIGRHPEANGDQAVCMVHGGCRSGADACAVLYMAKFGLNRIHQIRLGSKQSAANILLAMSDKPTMP